jgi:hypothetical protein
MVVAMVVAMVVRLTASRGVYAIVV